MNDPNSVQLHIENVYKQYGEKVILDDIDLRVSKGELCTVVGPSGCGKSTLLRLILGQEPATRGKIFINGQPVGEPDTKRGIVYQRYSLFPNMTVLENTTLGLRMQRPMWENIMRPKEFDAQAMEYLARVKVFMDLTFNTQPRFYGNRIEIE